MFSSRYSEQELNQWQAASAEEKYALRSQHARASAARGQGERMPARNAPAAKMSKQLNKQDDWASECLFDCYNG